MQSMSLDPTLSGTDAWTDNDAACMGLALEEAQQAAREGEAPVGAVVARDGRVVARAHNLREARQDPTAHAELLALQEAARVLGRWRLTGCTLYVTLEPCAMCAGALVLARVDRLVYGAEDPKAGACGSVLNVVAEPRLNHRIPVTAGVRAQEAAALLRAFFGAKRRGSSVNACLPCLPAGRRQAGVKG